MKKLLATALATWLALVFAGSALATPEGEVDDAFALADAQATTTEANIANSLNNALLVSAEGQSCRLELPPLASLNEVRVPPFGMQGSDHTNGQSECVDIRLNDAPPYPHTIRISLQVYDPDNSDPLTNPEHPWVPLVTDDGREPSRDCPAQQPPQAGTSAIERCVLQEVYEFNDPVADMTRRAKLELLKPEIEGFKPVYSPIVQKPRRGEVEL